MTTQTPIIEIQPQHTTTLRQLTEILIKYYGLHEGRYQAAIGFRIGVGQVAGAEAATSIPGAIVGVENISLLSPPPEVQSPEIVDAAAVNPAPAPRKSTRDRK